MKQIYWRKNTYGDSIGEFYGYKILIIKEPHDGFSYKLTYNDGENELWLGEDGHISPNLKDFQEAKNAAIKKLKFFYVQQTKKSKDVQMLS